MPLGPDAVRTAGGSISSLYISILPATYTKPNGMEVIFNNEKITTQAANLAELVAERLPDTKGIAVAVGTTVVSRDKWAETPLANLCTITVIRATRGG